MDVRTEDLILNGLVYNKEFVDRVIPYITEEYFDLAERVIFAIIKDHYYDYDKSPSKEVIIATLADADGLNEDIYSQTKKYALAIFDVPYKTDSQWLFDTAEAYCKEKAVYNALVKSISIAEGHDTDTPKNAIPELLSDALGVGFSDNIGIDYIDDAEERWDRLHNPQAKIALRLAILNLITEGGFELKTLNVVIASTGVGKTANMVDFMAGFLLAGIDCLYISMEMAEEKIGTRLDANLMGIDFKELKNISKEGYFNRLEKIKKAGLGQGIIKEFPTSTASASDFDHLIKELRQKKGFVPQVVFIDYISICRSDRVKLSQGMYLYVKSIAEELRALAQKHNICMISATQTNRDGIDASDFSLKSVSESGGLAHTVDFAMGLMAPEDVADQGLILGKQLKNRYGDVNSNRRFVLGYDRSKSYFYDTDLDYNVIVGGGDVEEDIPTFDKSGMGAALEAERPDPTVGVIDMITENGIKW